MLWPVDPSRVDRVGQGVMEDRGESHRPHKGVDIFVAAGTPVVAPVAGRVIRVIDGRTEPADSPKGRAGLWVDMEETGKRRVHRFLHLGTATVKAGDSLSEGSPIGTVAEPNTSGLGATSHLHYEVREWGKDGEAYGDPIDPRRELADSLADKAYRTIPGLARAVGVSHYGDEKWTLVDRQVSRVYATEDPERRLIEARAALGAAQDAAGLPSLYGEVYKQGAHPVEGMKFTATQAAVPALKQGGKFIGDTVGSVWDQLPTGVKVGVAAVALGTVWSLFKR